MLSSGILVNPISMPKQHWMANEQRKWLKERIPTFLKAQQADTLGSVFFPDLNDNWCKLYPAQPPTAEELEKAGGNLEKVKKQGNKKTESVSLQCIIKDTENLLTYVQKRGSIILHVQNQQAVNVVFSR